MDSLFNNSHFWLIIAFSLTLILSFKYIKQAINNLLKDKIHTIEDEINSSDEILASAFALLNERTKELKAIDKILQDSMLKAQQTCDSHYEKSVDSLNNRVRKDKLAIFNYFHHQDQQAKLDSMTILLDKSIHTAEETIKKTLDNSKHYALVDKSLQAIANMIQPASSSR
jgi:F0F1-type ATP synthase membrane subunit b/b'